MMFNDSAQSTLTVINASLAFFASERTTFNYTLSHAVVLTVLAAAICTTQTCRNFAEEMRARAKSSNLDASTPATRNLVFHSKTNIPDSPVKPATFTIPALVRNTQADACCVMQHDGLISTLMHKTFCALATRPSCHHFSHQLLTSSNV